MDVLHYSASNSIRRSKYQQDIFHFYPGLLHIIFCSLDATAVQRAGFGLGSGPIHLDNVACTGSEAALINCTYDPITTDCSHSEDAGVRCSLTRTLITSTHMIFKQCDHMYGKVTYMQYFYMFFVVVLLYCTLSRSLQ